MPFDGIAVKTIVDNLNHSLSEGRVEKALQPERDEIILVIRARGENHRLLLSASANCARIHITKIQKENPNVPPVFCMLLRKHLAGGKIIDFSHIDYDRIIEIKFLTTDDFGESCYKYLIIEIMGRHSNVILLNQEKKIIDSIKHIDFDISSVREVMPGRQYTLPPQQNKISPAVLNEDSGNIRNVFIFKENEIDDIKEMRIDKFILDRIKGFSPMLSREVCEAAGIDTKFRCNEILFGSDSEHNIASLCSAIQTLLNRINCTGGQAYVFFKDQSLNQPFDYYFTDMKQYEYKKVFESFSQALDFFYSRKDGMERLQQKKSDLIKVISTNIDRCLRKIGLQESALKDASERGKYKLYGELITANIYQIKTGSKSVTIPNYYSETMENITISLDPGKTANVNAQNYFRKYTKAKSTYTNATKQLSESNDELTYLQSVMQMLETASESGEISEIRDELVSGNYVKAKKNKGKSGRAEKSLKPRVFYAKDGTEILVGRNNIQNDMLTLKNASNNDYWLHTKNIPGSHVIIRTKGSAPADETLIRAAQIASFYSKASDSQNVPVDYTQVRHVHKPSGAKPGMVIYENQKTLYVDPVDPDGL